MWYLSIVSNIFQYIDKTKQGDEGINSILSKRKQDELMPITLVVQTTILTLVGEEDNETTNSSISL